MNRAIKYRLYPADKQAIMFAKTFECCRKVCNLKLTDNYEETGSFGRQVPVALTNNC